jgi:hypothetical protein
VQDFVLIVFFLNFYNWGFCFVIISAFYRVISFSWPGSQVSMIYLVWVRYFFRSFLESVFFFFFIIWHWLIGLWALWIVHIFFCGVIRISYLRLQVGQVNIGWLNFFRLIFYSVLSFAIKLLTLEYCHCFHLPLREVIHGAWWSNISASPLQINDTSSSMVGGVARVAFYFFLFHSLLLDFRVGLKKIKSIPRVCYT